MTGRPLKFLHLTTFYPPYSFGGDAMYLYRLCHALGDAGHEVDVVHCVDSYHLLHPEPPPIAFTPHPRVTVHSLRSPWKSLSPLATQQSGRPWLKGAALKKIFAAKPYDVVHFHNTSLLGPKLLTWNPPQGKSVKLYTTHEHWLICPTHVLWKFNSRPCEAPACLRCTLQARRPPQLWRYTGLLRRCARHVDQFVSPSRFTAKMHADRGFSQPVAHLPYFIDRVDHEWQNEAPRPQPEPYFLFVGRLETIKGLQTLIPQWRHVPNADLLVVGDGAYRQQLEALAAGEPRIKFLGPKPQSELGRLYRHAVACIVPSITYETFGLTLIESLARKSPVIARDLGALPEVVHDSGGGLVYRTDEEFLAAARRLSADPELRRSMAEQGYDAFVAQWSREAHLKLYDGFIRAAALRRYGSASWGMTVDGQADAAHVSGPIHDGAISNGAIAEVARR